MVWTYDEKTCSIKDNKGKTIARIETYNVPFPDYDKNARKMAAAAEMYDLLCDIWYECTEGSNLKKKCGEILDRIDNFDDSE